MATGTAQGKTHVRGYGWTHDLPDHRDHVYGSPLRVTKLPASTDLRAQCPPVYDQGQLGSCTANAIAAAIDFERAKQRLSLIYPSRLFIYYNERVIEHTVASDAGAQIRDGIKTVANQGACPEKLWPYTIGQFAKKPPNTAYAAATRDRVVQYSRISQDLNQFKNCLASGYPFVLGFTVYASFESAAVAKSGDVPMPSAAEKVMGGHAVVAVGYDDKTQRFLVRNSWGTGWGKRGYFTMPYAYLTQANLASDFWTVRLVTQAQARKQPTI